MTKERMTKERQALRKIKNVGMDRQGNIPWEAEGKGREERVSVRRNGKKVSNIVGQSSTILCENCPEKKYY